MQIIKVSDLKYTINTLYEFADKINVWLQVLIRWHILYDYSYESTDKIVMHDYSYVFADKHVMCDYSYELADKKMCDYSFEFADKKNRVTTVILLASLIVGLCWPEAKYLIHVVRNRWCKMCNYSF